LNNKTGPYLEAELKENIFDIKQRLLIVDSKFISYEEKIMSCEDITEIRYGIMQMMVFHRLRTDKYFKIELKNKRGEIIKIFFGHSVLNEGNSTGDENFDRIINSLWHAVKKRLVNDALDKILSGNSFSAGNCILEKAGVKYNYMSWRKKETFIPWSEVVTKMGYGKFYIYSNKHHQRKCKINFLHTWNSVVLYSIIEYFLKNFKEKDNKSTT